MLVAALVVGCKNKPAFELPEKKSKWVQDRGDSDADIGLTPDRWNKSQQFYVRDKNERFFYVLKEVENGDTVTTIEVSDSTAVVASFMNGKWEIKSCEKAMEVFIYCLMQMQDDFNKREVELMNRPKETPIYSINNK